MGRLWNNTASKTLEYWKVTCIVVTSSTASPNELDGCRFRSSSVRGRRINCFSMAWLFVSNYYYRVYIQLGVNQLVKLPDHIGQGTGYMDGEFLRCLTYIYYMFLSKNRGNTLRQNEMFQKIFNVPMFAYWIQKLINFVTFHILFYDRRWLVLKSVGTKTLANTIFEIPKVKCKLLEITANKMKRKIKTKNGNLFENRWQCYISC